MPPPRPPPPRPPPTRRTCWPASRRPAHHGEGPFALWHLSEDRGLATFQPHVPATNPEARSLVWAVDTRHAPMFWFPRDCPRGCIWPCSTTTEADRQRFFGQGGADRVHVMEAAWLDRMRACRLSAHRLPADGFRPHDVGGYWVSDRAVTALERRDAGDLLQRHATAGIELRVVPSIRPFWRRVTVSSVAFSGLRLRNAAPAAPHADRGSS